jgi:hypothetical protein
VDLTLPFRDAKARVVEEFESARPSRDPRNFCERLTRYGLRNRARPTAPSRASEIE